MDTNEQFTIKQVFDSMDVGNTGHIKAIDLQRGLSNGTDEPFNITTCKMMIGMFDRDGTRTIDFNEFSQLYQFVNQWVAAFRSNCSEDGEITQSDLNRLLNDLGYRLSSRFYTFIGLKFNLNADDDGLKFDDFLWICIMLHMCTGIFSSMDVKRENEVELSFDQFLCVYMDITSI